MSDEINRSLLKVQSVLRYLQTAIRQVANKLRLKFLRAEGVADLARVGHWKKCARDTRHLKALKDEWCVVFLIIGGTLDSTRVWLLDVLLLRCILVLLLMTC